MILTADGEVLTNNHVVAGAETVTVSLFGQSDALPARVIGTDPSQDLALVQIEGQHGLPTVRLGDSNASQVGDDVLAIGNALRAVGRPHGDRGHRVVEGPLALRHQRSHRSERDADRAPADRRRHQLGQLGRPAGQHLGAGDRDEHRGGRELAGNAPAQGIGFAIAIDTIKPLLALLRSGGTGG